MASHVYRHFQEEKKKLVVGNDHMLNVMQELLATRGIGPARTGSPDTISSNWAGPFYFWPDRLSHCQHYVDEFVFSIDSITPCVWPWELWYFSMTPCFNNVIHMVGVIFRPYGRKISANVCYFPSGTENNVRLYAIFRPYWRQWNNHYYCSLTLLSTNADLCQDSRSLQLIWFVCQFQ